MNLVKINNVNLMQSYTTKVYYANFFGTKCHFNLKYDGFANCVYVLQVISERFAIYVRFANRSKS